MSKNKGQTATAVILTVVGLVLMTGKIYVDSEPGLIPLVLTVVGAGWYVAIKYRRKRKTPDGQLPR